MVIFFIKYPPLKKCFLIKILAKHILVATMLDFTPSVKDTAFEPVPDEMICLYKAVTLGSLVSSPINPPVWCAQS